MNLRKLTAKNAVANWLSLITSSIVGFLLAPFVLHRLGDSAYGLYYLIISATSYYGLLSLGVRSSVVRYVANFKATGNEEDLCRVVNTCFFSYLVLGSLVFGLTLLGSAYVDAFFKISPSFLRDAQLLFIISGTALAINFPLSVFSGILEGLQKFYLMSPFEIFCTLLRAGLVVFFLDRGLGLLTVALITCGINMVLYNVFCIIVVMRIQKLHWGLRFIDRRTFRLVAHYSLNSFVVTLSGMLRGGAENIVTGIFISPAAITFYSIGEKLSEYIGRIVRNLAFIFIPMASHLHATNDETRMRKLFVEGNRICTFISFPFAALLIIMGKPIISLWMGPQYVAKSYIILVLLTVPAALWFSQATSTRILYGINQHVWLAKVYPIEGAASLAISLLLVRRLGIVGVAMGAAIPLVFTGMFVIAPHLCKILKMSLLQAFAQTYLPPLGMCVPLIFVLLLFRWFSPTPSLSLLIVQVVSGGAVYAAGLFWLFLTREPMGIKMRGRLLQYLPRTFSHQ